MSKVVVIKKGLKDRGWEDAWLLKKGDEYFVASGITVMGKWEVLVFPSNSEGQETSMTEVAGEKGISHEEAVKQLEGV